MSDMVKAYINDIEVNVPRETTILEAARQYEIDIPTLCFLEEVNEIGACRMCVVQIEGHDNLRTACNTYIKEGMVVYTNTEKVTRSREFMLKLILASHDVRCLICTKSGACKLQDLASEFGLNLENPYKKNIQPLKEKTKNPFLSYYPQLCIGCQRCVSMCDKIVGNGVIYPRRIGTRSLIDTPFGEDWSKRGCEFCGNCANVCPTGALVTKNMSKYQNGKVDKVLTTCPNCATGCQIYLVIKNKKIVDILPANGLSNKGILCAKGKFGLVSDINEMKRIKYPLVKNKETGEFERATWNEALEKIASKFLDIKNKYGVDCLAGFTNASMTNEDLYMFQKMIRCAFGTNNINNSAIICSWMFEKEYLKNRIIGDLTNSVEDITKDVDAIILFDANPEKTHPVVGMKIRQAIANKAKLVVVNSRKTKITKDADVYVKIKPGTNVEFIKGVVNIMIKDGLVDKEFINKNTKEYEKICGLVKEYTAQDVAKICNIDVDKIIEIAHLYSKSKKVPIISDYSAIENDCGVEGVINLENMALMVGKLHKRGCGVNILCEQNNVVGACDMGVLPNLFPGYQDVTDSKVVEKFEKAWNTSLNRKVGVHFKEQFSLSTNNKIRGLFVLGEDLIKKYANQENIKEVLESLDFLVVSDLVMTDTAKYADVILPSASFVEKEGTSTNLECRMQRVRKAVAVEGDIKLDTDVFINIMNRMGYKQQDMTTTQILDEIARVIPSFSNVDHEKLDSGELIDVIDKSFIKYKR